MKFIVSMGNLDKLNCYLKLNMVKVLLWEVEGFVPREMKVI